MELVQNVTSVSLRDALRAETAELHLRLEQAVDARGSFECRAAYSQWLQIMQQMHVRFAADYDAGSEALGLPPLSARLTAALSCDTGRELADRRTPSLPAGCEIGAAYVFEGSALGARVLLRRTERMLSAPTAYLSTLVAESRDRWPHVKRRCAEVKIIEPAQAHPAVRGARIVFDTFQRAFTNNPA